jgi:hypothetical protein
MSELQTRAKLLYVAASLPAFVYVITMAGHAGSKVDYLGSSGVPEQWVSGVFYGSLALSVLFQTVAASFASGYWIPSRLRRVVLSSMVCIGAGCAIAVLLVQGRSNLFSIALYSIPQIMILAGGAGPGSK